MNATGCVRRVVTLRGADDLDTGLLFLAVTITVYDVFGSRLPKSADVELDEMGTAEMSLSV